LSWHILGDDKKVWLLELSPEKLEDLRKNNEQARRARE